MGGKYTRGHNRAVHRKSPRHGFKQPPPQGESSPVRVIKPPEEPPKA